MNETKKKITPELAAGFRDYLPEDMIPRQKMLDTIRDTFELFGFVPLDTPAIEKEEILTGGDEDFRMRIFRTNVQMGFDKLAMRFDLTVPLARVIAQYPNEIKKPFKRYQVGKVWRAEKPQAGRFREFIQFDADIVGSHNMIADAEIIALMYETLTALGLTHFLIRVNNRKILNGLSDYAGFSHDQIVSVLRSIDKLDKQGWDAVREELQKPVTEEGSGLNDEQVRCIRTFLDIHGNNQQEMISMILSEMSNASSAQEGAYELQKILYAVRALGVPDDKWSIDLSVARGLGYYTGPVFETILTDYKEIGSVFSGGRYDDLVDRFGSVSVPATGASVGVDRLFAAMEKLGKIEKSKAISDVIILNFDTECEDYIQSVATMLRHDGINTEIYFGNDTMLKGQLSYVLNLEIPVVLIAGSSEKEKKTVQIKNVVTRKQNEVLFENITSEVRTILNV